MMCTLDLGFTGSIIFSTDGEKSTSAVFAIMVYKKRDGSTLNPVDMVKC